MKGEGTLQLRLQGRFQRPEIKAEGVSTTGRSLQNLGSATLLRARVPALEDRTGGLEAAGTEDMTPRGPEPFPSASVHYGDRDRTPDPRQEKEGAQASSRTPNPATSSAITRRTSYVAVLQKTGTAAERIYKA